MPPPAQPVAAFQGEPGKRTRGQEKAPERNDVQWFVDAWRLSSPLRIISQRPPAPADRRSGRSCTSTAVAILPSSSTCSAVVVAKECISRATIPVQPV